MKLLTRDGTAASFASRLPGNDKRGIRPLPQAIGHRGFKAEFPENTMEAFRGAIEIGAHAVETDVHLSKDKVVVLSHASARSRCRTFFVLGDWLTRTLGWLAGAVFWQEGEDC